MSARQYATTVGTTATVIEGTQFPGFRLKNNGAAEVFIGDSAVTTSNGYPLAVDEVFTPSELGNRSLRGTKIDRLYGVVASSTEDVRVIIEGRHNI